MKNLIIICDIDGTIALRGDRSPHDHDASMEDAVNKPIVNIVNAMIDAVEIDDLILVSGRDEKYRDVTEYWLETHRVFNSPNYSYLFMRPRGDNRPDEVVKREIYEQKIKDKYDVLCVFDDRNKVVKMWRDLGLTCLQVAEGDF